MEISLCIVAGARPNFMKIAPIIDEIKQYNKLKSNKKFSIKYFLVHTGQHYDKKMSDLFFSNLGIPIPEYNLEVGSASHSVQTAEIMKKFEQVCLENHPTHVLVVGDVNSTIACALVASKMGICIIHIEAGLRSFDRKMPEEVNRVLTDSISDYLFITEESAYMNLKNEGIPEEKIHFVGNVMIDTLLQQKKKAENSTIRQQLKLYDKDSNKYRSYALLTLHRPSNVDNKEKLTEIINALRIISKKLPILFPVHPRTLNSIRKHNLEKEFHWIKPDSKEDEIVSNSIHCISPLGYLDFLNLMNHSSLVLTDSGGIQEETTILRVPCVTLRENTERPVTIELGTNILAGTDRNGIIDAAIKQIDLKKGVNSASPPLWDGKASQRIIQTIVKLELLKKGIYE